jgi:hypothetical protein
LLQIIDVLPNIDEALLTALVKKIFGRHLAAQPLKNVFAYLAHLQSGMVVIRRSAVEMRRYSIWEVIQLGAEDV